MLNPTSKTFISVWCDALGATGNEQLGIDVKSWDGRKTTRVLCDERLKGSGPICPKCFFGLNCGLFSGPSRHQYYIATAHKLLAQAARASGTAEAKKAPPLPPVPNPRPLSVRVRWRQANRGVRVRFATQCDTQDKYKDAAFFGWSDPKMKGSYHRAPMSWKPCNTPYYSSIGEYCEACVGFARM